MSGKLIHVQDHNAIDIVLDITVPGLRIERRVHLCPTGNETIAEALMNGLADLCGKSIGMVRVTTEPLET